MFKHTTFLESAVLEDTNEVLVESTVVTEPVGKKWKVRVIQGDVQGTSAFYPKELLESIPNVVKEGTPIYIDHKQPGERPERKAENLAGYFETESYFEGGDIFAEASLFSDKVEWVKERAKAKVIALSIHGQGNTFEENGRKVAKTIDKIHSVDIVTAAGAGGTFVEMTESTPQQKEETMELPKEFLEALDTQNNAITELVEATKEQNKKVNEFIESQKPVKEEEETPKITAAEVSEALVEAGLTKQGRASVYTAVESGTDLEEAITAEKEREKEILTESNAKFGTGGNGEQETKSASQLIFG